MYLLCISSEILHTPLPWQMANEEGLTETERFEQTRLLRTSTKTTIRDLSNSFHTQLSDRRTKISEVIPITKRFGH
jgi:hypothetical protein